MFFYICFSHSLPHKNVFVHTLLKNFCKISKFFWQFAYFPPPFRPDFLSDCQKSTKSVPRQHKKSPSLRGLLYTALSRPASPTFFGKRRPISSLPYARNLSPLGPLCKGSCQRQLTEGLYEEVFVAFLLHTKQKQRVLAENFNGETTACARSAAPLNRGFPSLFAPFGAKFPSFPAHAPHFVWAKRA